MRITNKRGWKQVDAARHCGVTQPCVNDLLRNRISRFSLDAKTHVVITREDERINAQSTIALLEQVEAVYYFINVSALM